MHPLQALRCHLNRVPRWLRVVLAAMVFAVAAALVVPYFLDVDRYRTLAASALESRTGRKVTIGKIRARLLPRLGFVVEDFRLSNPPGFAEGNVLTVEIIRGNLAVGPLLRREFRLDSVEFVRPKLWLVEDDQARANYSWKGRVSPAQKESQTAKTDSGTPLRLAELGTVTLSDAELILGRVASRKPELIPALRARKVSVELEQVALDPMEPKRWEGQARLNGIVLELSGWKVPIEVRSGRLTLHGGQLQAEFRAGMGKIAEWKGTVRVDDIERAVPTFEFTTSQLDVDQLLAAQADTSPSSRRARIGKPEKSELAAQGRLAAERLLWQPYVGGKALAEIRVFTDRAELWPLQVELYGGTLQISARSDRTQQPDRFSANIQVRNLDVGRMLAASSEGRSPKLTGRGELDLQLFGSLGENWRRSLSGNGRFAVHDGRLPGVNLAGALGLLAKVAGIGGDTPFHQIRGDLAISESRVRSRLIHMDSPRGTVELHGSFGLDGGLDYEGQAVLETNLAAPAGGQSPMDALTGILGAIRKEGTAGNPRRMTVPFALRGTFAAPQIRPGRGLPSVASAPEPSQAQPQKKPGLLDLFRRP